MKGTLALLCPYCGGSLFINQQTVGSAYMATDIPESIDCEASDCEASWEPNGFPRAAPKWELYPGLYCKPARAQTFSTAEAASNDA